MKQIVIVGTGGHAREVAGIFEDCNRCHPGIEVLGFIDENAAHHGKSIAGKPVLGDFSWFDRVPPIEKLEVILRCWQSRHLAKVGDANSATESAIYTCDFSSKLDCSKRCVR